MINSKSILKIFSGFSFVLAILISSCEADEPTREDSPEMITKVILTFTGEANDTVIATATDPDGDGVKNMTADSVIKLLSNQEYSLSIKLLNQFASEGSPEYVVSDEVKEESDEHLFFFGWTQDIFLSPTGDGNVDSRLDPVQYADKDLNGLPVGLQTVWLTSGKGSGTFRLLLKHQPGHLKTETSTAKEGETDLDVTFDIVIQ